MRISDWSSDMCSSDLREEPGIPTVEVVELEGFDADSSPQADPWIEVSFGDADGRRRSMELGFGALYVRSPVRQLGGQTHRYIGRKRRQGHRFKQLRIKGARLISQPYRHRETVG